MSEVLRVPNFSSINLLEQTTLDADALSGQNQITLLNQIGYTVGNKILVGIVGGETSEVQEINGIAGKLLTLTANLNNRHLKYEVVTLLVGDQVRLYRANNVDGSVPDDSLFVYTGISGSIRGGDTTTDLADPLGSSAYWYKTTYYNSVTGDETALVASVAVRGGNYGHLVSIESIRREAGLVDNQTLDDSIIAERRDQAESEIIGNLASAGYVIPLTASNGMPYVPPIVENIARLLAAGYLLEQEYGPTTDGDTKNGKQKIKQAQRLLDQIQNQNIVLLDPTGVMLYRASQVAGWPDNTTQFVGTDGVHGEPFVMTMSKRF